MGKRTPFVAVVAALLTGLLFVQFAVRSTPADNSQFSEKANLALRRTAHRLLLAAGDSTSKIPAVQQTDAHTFLVRFTRSFHYDQLPELLQQSLKLHGIATEYDVAVRDCTKGELQLGYTVRDLTEKSNVPCVGREHEKGCYTLQVRFLAPETTSQQAAVWWVLVAGGVLAGLAWFVRQKGKTADTTVGEPETDASEKIRFGGSSLDVANQLLASGQNHYNLTYREAKLLRLFAKHPNQLLERDFILKSVWEDEGIIVGRSVDVFVSRLRKLLQDDASLRIAAVHGVGYRLEIRSHESA